MTRLASRGYNEIPVQILGKLRGVITVPAGSDQSAILAAAKADPKIAEQLAGKQIVKEIFVPASWRTLW